MGVNMVMFALKQRGGITEKKIDYTLSANTTTRWWGEGDKEDFVKIVR